MNRLPFVLVLANIVACTTASAPKRPVSVPAEDSSMIANDSMITKEAEPYEVFLESWDGPHGGVPPWDKLNDEASVGLLEPAMKEASNRFLSEIDAIATNPQPPTFVNTILALEQAGQALERVATLFFTLASSRAEPEVIRLAGILRPLASSVQDKVILNPELFARVKAIYEHRSEAHLNPDQLRLVEKRYEDFLLNGANLSADAKIRVSEINLALAKLFTEFSKRVLADEDTWILLSEDDLAGLSESLVAAYKAAAQERNIDGYAVVNTRSAVDPFLTFSKRRNLRERVWKAFKSRGDNGDKNDTKAIISQIVTLRAERAQLYGYKSHAHWRLKDKMAKEPQEAMALMMRVWPAAKARVQEEVAMMTQIAKGLGQKDKIRPWDYLYYMEKVRAQKYSLNQNEFKKYFELDNMIQASYYMASRLYGFDFKEVTGEISTFHPDVRVFEVTNQADGSYVGLLYRDDFARQHKRSGAWMSSYQTQSQVEGQKVFPIVSNNNNFVKGAEDTPVLISLDDAQTLFHEFGHALHGLLNNTRYPYLSRTPRDFVEFPSQVHENWVLTREVLDTYARHYETNEPMPQTLIGKMQAASTHSQGYATVEYLSAALVDMKLHMDPEGRIDPELFESQALEDIGMPEQIALRHRLPNFQHLFSSDGYSAGYYSYLWSEVMAADAWKAFKETGDTWHPEVAKKFKDIILATGDEIDRAEAYRQFRGRDPDVEALLEDRGFN